MERLPFGLRCFVTREERLSQGHGAEPFRVGDVEVRSAIIILFISWGAHRAKLESLSSLSSQIEPDPQPVNLSLVFSNKSSPKLSSFFCFPSAPTYLLLSPFLSPPLALGSPFQKPPQLFFLQPSTQNLSIPLCGCASFAFYITSLIHKPSPEW